MDTLPHDIEPIVSIIESSLYYFILTVIIGVIFLYFTMKFLLNNINFKNNHKIMLDWNNSKDTAYKITELGRKLATTERSEKLFAELQISLEDYKYRTNVPNNISDEVRGKFNIFLEVAKSE